MIEAARPPAAMTEISPAAWAACRAITRRHARSFYFASHALPPGKRRAAYAVYAFCRHVDDQVDRAPDAAAVAAALEAQRGLLDALEQGTGVALRLPWAPAFVAVWREAAIPRAWLEDLLTGMTLDRGEVRVATWEELDRYCYHVASVVGLIMTRVFAADPDDALLARAADLGTAMQLTNILRDVGEDYRMGRVYLPQEELARFGVSEAYFAAGRVTDNFRRLMEFQISRARDYYLRSEPGIGRLPNDGTRRTVWTMREVYAAILGRIERNGCDVFTRRARVGLGGKLALAARAWGKSRRRA
jgi:phytoene synthase